MREQPVQVLYDRMTRSFSTGLSQVVPFSSLPCSQEPTWIQSTHWHCYFRNMHLSSILPYMARPTGCCLPFAFYAFLIFPIRAICPATLIVIRLDEESTSWSSSLTVCLPVNRDTVVGIATRYGLHDRGVGVPVSIGSRIFSSPRRRDRLWGPPNLLSSGYRG
jgi:hypothetical protein